MPLAAKGAQGSLRTQSAKVLGSIWKPRKLRSEEPPLTQHQQQQQHQQQVRGSWLGASTTLDWCMRMQLAHRCSFCTHFGFAGRVVSLAPYLQDGGIQMAAGVWMTSRPQLPAQQPASGVRGQPGSPAAQQQPAQLARPSGSGGGGGGSFRRLSPSPGNSSRMLGQLAMLAPSPTAGAGPGLGTMMPPQCQQQAAHEIGAGRSSLRGGGSIATPRTTQSSMAAGSALLLLSEEGPPAPPCSLLPSGAGGMPPTAAYQQSMSGEEPVLLPAPWMLNPAAGYTIAPGAPAPAVYGAAAAGAAAGGGGGGGGGASQAPSMPAGLRGRHGRSCACRGVRNEGGWMAWRLLCLMGATAWRYR